MNVGELLVISVALAVDAASYAFSYGLVLRQQRMASALLLGCSVGVFQAGMPLLGYMGGVGLRSAVQAWGQWIVCGIFVALGVSIICKSWRGGEDEVSSSRPLGFFGLMLVGIATSLDAFAVGVCMALGHVIGQDLTAAEMGLAVGVIGLVAFVGAVLFFYLSGLLRRLPERVLQTLAGLLLIALGAKALW